MAVEEIWNFETGKNKRIEAYTQSKTQEKIYSPAEVRGDGKLAGKYLNKNTLAFITKLENKNVLTFYLLDTISGKILKSFIHKNARPPLLIQKFENRIFYFYFNSEKNDFQFSSISLFFKHSLSPKIFSNFQRNLFGISSLNENEDELHFSNLQNLQFLMKSFYVNSKINHFALTQSKQGITPKNLIIATSSGSLVALDVSLFDPRRPFVNQTDAIQLAEGLPIYKSVIEWPSQAILSHKYHVKKKKKLFFTYFFFI